MSADSKTVTENCPHDTADGEDCEGTVTVDMEYEPEDRNYGADRDGNRGRVVGGYWSATAADACSLGCVLDDDAKADVAKDAIWQAEHDRADEYYGPDGPDDEC